MVDGERRFYYGDVVEVVEGEHKGAWGYYDDDDILGGKPSDIGDDWIGGEDALIILLHAAVGTDATEALIAGRVVVVPARFCRLRQTVKKIGGPTE